MFIFPIIVITIISSIILMIIVKNENIDSKIIRKWNKLQKKSGWENIPEPILEFMPDKKLYRAMKRIAKAEGKR